MDIGKALKHYRKTSKMTQTQVAEYADVNEKYYGELERNESSPTLDRLEKISKALGVELQQLVGYRPLVVKEGGVAEFYKPEMEDIYAYCNCCGSEFYCAGDNICCPECGCQYSEENDYIEIY